MVEKKEIIKTVNDIDNKLDKICEQFENIKIEISNLTEIEDFLYSLSKREDLPGDVQDKANELWSRI